MTLFTFNRLIELLKLCFYSFLCYISNSFVFSIQVVWPLTFWNCYLNIDKSHLLLTCSQWFRLLVAKTDSRDIKWTMLSRLTKLMYRVVWPLTFDLLIFQINTGYQLPLMWFYMKGDGDHPLGHVDFLHALW